MNKTVKLIPDGYHTVTPYLMIKRAAQAIDFYKKALGAEEIFRMNVKGMIGHAEIQIGNSRIMMADEFHEMKAFSPAKRAVEAGTKVLKPVVDQFYGDRMGTFEDPFGHAWSIATHIEDLSAEEMAERSKKSASGLIVMERAYWQNKWVKGEIGFHQEAAHPLLIEFISALHPDFTAGKKGEFARGKIMVPLCGKSLDLLFLRDQGFEGVGIEFSAIACDAFFQENQLPVQIEKWGDVSIYRSTGITVWCGDIFQVPNEAWQNVTTLYDRAAMVALPIELRKKYQQLLIEKFWKAESKKENSILKKMLLISLEYDQAKVQGPPFSVSETEVHDVFKPYQIKKLQERPEDDLADRSKFKLTSVTEKVYLITSSENGAVIE